MKTWHIRLGRQNEVLDEALEQSVIAIGFDIRDNTTLKHLLKIGDVEAAKDWLKNKLNLESWDAGQVARFVLEMQLSDYVVSGPVYLYDESEEREYLIGVVKSEPFMLEEPLGGYMYLAREVEWKFVPEDKFPSLHPGQQTLSSLEKQLSREEAELLFEGKSIERIEKINQGLDEVIEEIKSVFLSMDWKEFEDYIKDLLETNGWGIIELTPRTRDEGIDIIADVPILTGTFKSVIVQVKKRRRLTTRDVDEIITAHEKNIENLGHDLFYLITAGTITKSAREKLLEHPSLILIDGTELARAALAIDLIPGVSWPFKKGNN